MRKIKILFIIPSLSGGGAERILGYLSKQLAKDKNYEINIAIFENNITYEYGGNLIKLKKVINSKKTIYKIINRLFYIYQLKKIKKNKEIEISVSFLEISDIFNFFSSNKKEILITSIRNNLDVQYKTIINDCTYKFLGKIYVKIHKSILKYFDKIISISKGDQL